VSSTKKNLFLKEIKSILHLTGKCWIKAEKKTFLFTGCTGFFGIWLIKSFIEADKKFNLRCKIYILTRNKKIKKTLFFKIMNSKKINFIFSDIRDLKKIKLKEVDYIVHGATTSALETFNKQSYKKKYSIIVDGTKNILNLCKKLNCSNFFYMSSGAVYGYSKNFTKLKESKKIKNSNKISRFENDITILGKAKFKAEQLILDAFKKNSKNFIIGRFFSFVGPFMPLRIHYAAGNFLKSLILKENINLNSSGKSIRTYMYIKDCIIWIIISIFLNNKSKKGIYNIGGEHSLTILNLAKKILSIKDIKLKVKINNKNKKYNCYVPCIKKFKNSFNPPKQTGLITLLTKTFDHIDKNKSLYEM